MGDLNANLFMIVTDIHLGYAHLSTVTVLFGPHYDIEAHPGSMQRVECTIKRQYCRPRLEKALDSVLFDSPWPMWRLLHHH